jgi:hypothetical protein
MNREIIKKLMPHLGFVLVYILWGINMTSLKICCCFSEAYWELYI